MSENTTLSKSCPHALWRNATPRIKNASVWGSSKMSWTRPMKQQKCRNWHKFNISVGNVFAESRIITIQPKYKHRHIRLYTLEVERRDIFTKQNSFISFGLDPILSIERDQFNSNSFFIEVCTSLRFKIFVKPKLKSSGPVRDHNPLVVAFFKYKNL